MAREYDPTLGRFLSVDPVLDTYDPQSIDSYGYADNNPATNTDPTGTICVNNQGDPVPCGSKGTTRNNPVPTPAGPPAVGPPASGPEPSGGGNGSEHSGGQTPLPCNLFCQAQKTKPPTSAQLLQIRTPEKPVVITGKSPKGHMNPGFCNRAAIECVQDTLSAISKAGTTTSAGLYVAAIACAPETAGLCDTVILPAAALSGYVGAYADLANQTINLIQGKDVSADQ